jgi:DNA-binding winged helix-turn-helix (wHTH) protein
MSFDSKLPGSSPDAFFLGEWLVEPRLNRISAGGSTIQLEHRVMEVLVCLADHAGDLVTRRDLVDKVWDEGFISDNTITHAVTELRKAFGDDPRMPKVIETIHRRGYRLIAPVIFDRATPLAPAGRPSSFLAILRDVEIQLAEGENVIGRAPQAAITVPSIKASREHARIIVDRGLAFLEDLDSKNGTFLNGLRIHHKEQLSSGDLIGIGSVTETIRIVDAFGGATTESEYDA